MNNNHFILFDLDGTLTDPGEGITRSVAYALSRFGIRINDLSELYTFIGPPLSQSFMRYFAMSKENAEQAICYYREFYSVEGIFQNRLYPGIEAFLQSLKSNGRTLVLATSKPTIFAERILTHFYLSSYFSFTSGSNLNGTRVEKNEVIEFALKSMNISPQDALMIGDRKHDIRGAKQNHVASVGVTYGYGSLEELRLAGADYIVHSVTELSKLILPNSDL